MLFSNRKLPLHKHIDPKVFGIERLLPVVVSVDPSLTNTKYNLSVICDFLKKEFDDNLFFIKETELDFGTQELNLTEYEFTLLKVEPSSLAVYFKDLTSLTFAYKTVEDLYNQLEDCARKIILWSNQNPSPYLQQA